MFINTANTKIEKSGEQLVYDSRNPKVKKTTVESNHLNVAIDEKKIKNIIEMYNKRRPVFCNIKYDDEYIEGIPYKREGNILSVYLTDSKSINLEIEKILYISIIRF